MKQISFVIASHSYLINKGLSLIINEIRNTRVLEIIESAEELEKSLEAHQPDFLIVTDELLKDINEKLLNDLYKKSSDSKTVLIITSGQEVKKHGDYRLKLTSGKKETSGFFLNLIEQNLEETSENDRELSERERTILRYVAMGKINKEIAEELFLSKHTVITHRKNITNKLGIKSISGLTVYALMNGIISMEEVE